MDEVSSTRDLIVAGLKAEALRQKATAGNIANLETPGYRRLDVKFEELLADALDKAGGRADARQIEPELYEPRNTPVKANGNDVNLELEIGQMVENTLRHETLVRLLIKKVNAIDQIIDVP